MRLNAGTISNRSNTNDGSPSYSIAGKRPDSNRFTMNGVDYVGNNAAGVYTSPQGMSGYLLGVDAVREFNVVGHTYGAEYGKRGGAQVTIVTTSGTNQLHGTAFEFLRNNVLDTRNYFDVADAPEPTPVAPFRRNQFGGSLGGPIIRDKMFAYGNYEAFRERLAVSQFGYVPSLQARQGLLPNASGVYAPVANPEPRMLPFFRYWPAPNGPELFRNGSPTGTAQYSANPGRAVQEDFGLARFDYNISSADSVSTNFTADKGQRTNPQDPTFLTDQKTDLYTLSAQETHIFSPTVLNIATFGYSTARADQQSPPVEPFPDNLLLMKGGSSKNPGAIIIGGGTATVQASSLLAPNGQNPYYSARRNYMGSNDLRLTKGRHSLSLGVRVERVEQTQFSSGQTNAGTITYPTLLTFLQDRPTLFRGIGSPSELNYRSTLAAWYFQDEIKLRPNLTVRLGLRDEMTTGWNEANGHAANYAFDQNGVLLTLPFTGKSALLENNAIALWQPRVGVAWDPTGSGKWSVRAGFGIHNDLQDNLGQRLGSNPPFSGRVTFENTPMLSFIPVNAEEKPAPSCTAVGVPAGCAMYSPGVVDPALRTPTLQQWSLTVERELAQDLMLEVGYLGSQSYHVITAVDMNSRQPVRCENAAGCRGGTVPQGTEYIPSGIPRPNPLLPSTLSWFYFGTSNYQALNLSLLKRSRGGLTFKTNYTWGKAMDINSAILAGQAQNEGPTLVNRFNRKLDRGIASYSILHQFNTNFSYQLPFGRGKAFGSGATGWVEKLIGGWQWNSIFNAQGGFPISPLVGSNRSGNGDTRNPDVPNRNPDFKGNPVLGVDEFKKTGRYYDPNAFSVPLAGTFGNAGRSAFRGPGLVNVDTSLFKQIPLNERWKLQFRTEFFNILNHANFNSPNPIVFEGTTVSSTAGTITDIVSDGNGRQIQFALRLEF
jgi:hypothetical protein